MPDLFDRLRQETLRAAAENDLPDFLAARLLAIADHPDSYPENSGDTTLDSPHH